MTIKNGFARFICADQANCPKLVKEMASRLSGRSTG